MALSGRQNRGQSRGLTRLVRERPQELKPRVLAPFSARLKSRPDTKRGTNAGPSTCLACNRADCTPNRAQDDSDRSLPRPRRGEC